MKVMLAALLLLSVGCQPKPALDIESYNRILRESQPAEPVPAVASVNVQATPTAEGRRVVVVVNSSVPDSVKIGRTYAEKRGVPKENICLVAVPDGEWMKRNDFEKVLLPAVRTHLQGLRNIDYIVITRGIAAKYGSMNFSVDAAIGAMDLNLPEITDPKELGKLTSPYYGKAEPFTKAKFGFYLVTRLDGKSTEDALQLIENSLNAKPEKGPFLFDEAPNRKSKGYGEMQQQLGEVAELLKPRGFRVVLDQTDAFVGSDEPLAGYSSWGSNDSSYNAATYRALKFKPGAIAETFVSTSARTFTPTDTGQSLITDLISSGVTGVKGYVQEPYLAAMARPTILFDRYTRGFNLAESFYMASPLLRWKDTIIGDPLCRPYPRVRTATEQP
ncbi:MAG: TIGR03790 family protein [Fimbriimonas sp.]